MDFKLKYLKYKKKYLELQKRYEMIGGMFRPASPFIDDPVQQIPVESPADPHADPPVPSLRPLTMNIFETISNSGSLPELPGVSNSCMWISILHYLRYFGGQTELSLRDVRVLGNVGSTEHNNKIFDSKLAFHGDGIERICRHFNIQINVYAIGINNLLVIQDIFPHPSTRGAHYNPTHILRIASYGMHFEIITKSTQLVVNLSTSSTGVTIPESPKDQKLVFDDEKQEYIDQNEIETKLKEYRKFIIGKTGVQKDSIKSEIKRLEKIADKIKAIVSNNITINKKLLTDLNKRKDDLKKEISTSTELYQNLLSEGYQKNNQIIVEIISKIESDKKELEILKINIGLGKP
jgi:hypothetical protein